MKSNNYIILAIASVTLAYFTYNHYQKQPQTFDSKMLVVSLMVKNEEPVMATTLQPLIDAGITQYFIYDTGSTDNTIAVTRDIFEKNKIQHFVIKQGPWIDFAASRNKALELTEQYFPCATFILMLDAEWILHNGANLLKFCQTQKNNTAIVYSVPIITNKLTKYEDRLFRTKSNIHFIGKVHEWANIKGQMIVPSPIFIEFKKTDFGNQKSEQRWFKDRDILLQEALNNPDNVRTTTTLAQTYFCLKDYKNAIKWYEKLISMKNQDNESLFFAYLYLSMSYDQAQETDKAIVMYLKTFEIRPCRAEPLIKLSELYFRKKDYALSFLFAKHAITIPFPINEKIGVEKYWYDVTRYQLVGATAHFFKEYDLGRQATLQALQSEPNSKYLQQLLNIYR